MYIRADNNGNIQLVSTNDNINCVAYNGIMPDDFLQSVGLGKYKFINAEIVPVTGWVMPLAIRIS